MPPQRGLTLSELMIALAVVGVLFGVALPAFSGGLGAARASEARACLLASLLSAATHASITGVHAVLCPSNDGAHCLDSADWSRGWLVFPTGRPRR